MLNAIIGQKLGQTQKFTKDGRRLPVSMVLTGPCTVIWQKEKKAQISFGERKNTDKAVLGHVKKAGLEKGPLFLSEVEVLEGEYKAGDKIFASDLLKSGDIVDVTGISRGKGFTGVVKRWHFKGGPRTHGQSDRERAPGSIGQTTTPGRVYKGKKMAGRSGFEQVTIKNLQVFEVDKEKNIVYLVGLIPGVVDSEIKIIKVGDGKAFLETVSEASLEAPEPVKEEVVETVEEKIEEKTEGEQNAEN